MLSKKLKLPLRQNKDFFNKSQKIFSSLFVLYFQKKQKDTRALVIIAKKNINKATARNKAKRRIYKILENKISKIDKTYLVLVLKKEIEKKTDQELELVLEKQLKKIL